MDIKKRKQIIIVISLVWGISFWILFLLSWYNILWRPIPYAEDPCSNEDFFYHIMLLFASPAIVPYILYVFIGNCYLSDRAFVFSLNIAVYASIIPQLISYYYLGKLVNWVSIRYPLKDLTWTYKPPQEQKDDD